MNDLTKKLLQEIDKPAFIKNEEGVYLACNSAFEKFLGVSKNQFLGQTAYSIAPKHLADIYTEADKELFARRSTQIYKAPVLGCDAIQPEIIVFTKTIFFDEQDQVSGFIGIIDLKSGLATLNSSQKLNTQDPRLTRREFEVLYLMSKGLATKEVAKMLQISNHTIADYTKSIYMKLGANNRVSAILAAQKLQLI